MASTSRLSTRLIVNGICSRRLPLAWCHSCHDHGSHKDGKSQEEGKSRKVCGVGEQVSSIPCNGVWLQFHWAPRVAGCGEQRHLGPAGFRGPLAIALMKGWAMRALISRSGALRLAVKIQLAVDHAPRPRGRALPPYKIREDRRRLLSPSRWRVAGFSQDERI